MLISSRFCGACRAYREALRELAEGGLPCFEADAFEASGLVAELEVFHLPALFLYINGEAHASLSAAPTAGAIREAVEMARLRPADPEL